MDSTFGATGGRANVTDMAFGQILHDDRAIRRPLEESRDPDNMILSFLSGRVRHVELTADGPVVNRVNLDDKSVLDVAKSVDSLSPAEKAAIEAWPVLSETTVCIMPVLPESLKGQIVGIACTRKDAIDLSPKEKQDYLERKQIHLREADTYVKLDEGSYLIIPPLPQFE
ncbi:MAG: hypothetical protein LCH63_17650 [Candidatus Melainabacteria bacterium]|nr:hypothetical protein [Candidatus Melainabacteria bacterium]OPZ88052.1 MAG: hypothetical protein BWY75_01728 [bacterium ADurb.Bin425]